MFPVSCHLERLHEKDSPGERPCPVAAAHGNAPPPMVVTIRFLELLRK